MEDKSILYDTMHRGLDVYLPSISVDCVIFSFHAKKLKVLLCKFGHAKKWMLPGGFVCKDEDIDDSAFRILEERTGLRDVYLRQFYLFGQKKRVDLDENMEMLKYYNIDPEVGKWYVNRFLSLGYYALIKHEDAKLGVEDSVETAWFYLDEVPSLYADHASILDKALSTIRQQIGFIPIGYELLPNKFTMPELRSIYEAVLGRELDRRNFQRKMLSIGFIHPLNETRRSGPHKSPNLYAFDKEKYDKAKEDGIQLMTASL